MLARYLQQQQPLVVECCSALACHQFDQGLLLFEDTPDARAFFIDGDLDALVRLVQDQPTLANSAPARNFVLRIGTVSIAQIGLNTRMFCINKLDGGSLKHDPQICVVVPKKRLMVLSNIAHRMLETIVLRHAAMEDFDRNSEERWIAMRGEYDAELLKSGVFDQLQTTRSQV